MIYFRLSTDGAYDGDDVQANLAIDAAVFDVVVHRALQALQLLIVYCLLGVAKKAVTTGLYFDKYGGPVCVSSNDVNVSVA